MLGLNLSTGGNFLAVLMDTRAQVKLVEKLQKTEVKQRLRRVCYGNGSLIQADGDLIWYSTILYGRDFFEVIMNTSMNWCETGKIITPKNPKGVR